MYKVFVKSIANVMSSVLVNSEEELTTLLDNLEADQNVTEYSVYHLEHKAFHSRSMYLLHTKSVIKKWAYHLTDTYVITDGSVYESAEYYREFPDGGDVKRIQLCLDELTEDFDFDELIPLWEGTKGPEDYPFIIIEC